MKIKNSIKKVGAVAGTAVMVGMTMGAAASLSDFPEPFVEDGDVHSQIVVGTDGHQADRPHTSLSEST
jgi:S-layer protein (TIGR01564 family)